MNIYQLKRDPSLVQSNEYAGFIVRAQNEEAAEDLVFENYSMERSDWKEEYYDEEFETTLLASGVIGEPTILMVDHKGYTVDQLEQLKEAKRILNHMYGKPMNSFDEE